MLIWVVVSVRVEAQSVSFAGLDLTWGTSGLQDPYGVAVDGAGDLFIADAYSDQVLEIPSGCAVSSCQISIGSGLYIPQGVAVDWAGDVFIADTNNNRVVEVPAGCSGGSCQIEVGSGLSHPENLTLDGAGDLFVADTDNSRVIEFPSGCTSDTCASILANYPQVWGPTDVAVDRAGDVFIADNGHNRVVEMPSGCTNSTCWVIVGSGFSYAYGVAVDVSGNLFVNDTLNNRVVEIPVSCLPASCQTTVVTGLDYPTSLTVDWAGDIYIADSDNFRVVEVQRRAVNFASVPIGSKSSLTLTYNVNASVNLGTNRVLTEGSTNLDFHLSRTTCTGNQAAGATCAVTVSFAPLAPGTRMGAVQLQSSDGGVLVTTLLRGQGVGPAISFPSSTKTIFSKQYEPEGLAIDAKGDVFVTNAVPSEVLEIPLGCTSSSCQTVLASNPAFPSGVALDGAGNVYLAGDEDAVYVIPPGCTSFSCQVPVGSGLPGVSSVAVDGAGNVFVAEYALHGYIADVVEIPAGCTSLNCQVTVASGLDLPAGLAVDSADNLYIANSFSGGPLVEIPWGCASTSCFVSIGSTAFTYGVAVDAAGDVFVAEGGYSGGTQGQVIEVPANCRPNVCQSNVDGQLGLMDMDNGVAVDAVGDIFIAAYYSSSNQASNKIIEMPRSQPPALAFPTTSVGSTSAAKPVHIQNIGNATLTFSGFSIATGFVERSTSCSVASPLHPGASCTIEVACAPKTRGLLTGKLTVTDNALNGVASKQLIPLSCTGD
jgi:sugar lactone lactonase YvrE